MFLNYKYYFEMTIEEQELDNKRVSKNRKQVKKALSSLIVGGDEGGFNKKYLKIAMLACLLVAASSSPSNAIEPGVALTAVREATKTPAFKETTRTAACISCGYCAKGLVASAQCGNAPAAATFACGMVCATCLYATASLIPPS